MNLLSSPAYLRHVGLVSLWYQFIFEVGSGWSIRLCCGQNCHSHMPCLQFCPERTLLHLSTSYMYFICYCTFVQCVTLTGCGNFAILGMNSGHIEMFNVQSGIHRGHFGRPKGSCVRPCACSKQDFVHAYLHIL